MTEPELMEATYDVEAMKPCPFCGNWDVDEREDAEWCSVECRCGACVIARKQHRVNAWYWDDARRAWNRRAGVM